MFVSHIDEIEKKHIVSPAVKAVEKQVLVGPAQGWEDYVMRRFVLGPHGYAPRHRHNWPHIMYVLEGNGILFLEGKEYDLQLGSVSYVPSEADHQVRNATEHPFAFICIVPKHGDV